MFKTFTKRGALAMNKNDISTLIRFNFWANDRLLAASEHLTPAEFRREVTPDPGWGSLRGVLVHTLDTEYGWRSILQAQETNTILEASDFAEVAALKACWDGERSAWLGYVTRLSDERLTQGYGRDSQHGPKVWQTIMHVVIHGTQHRGEAAFILTGYGHSPGELDFDLYLQENPESRLD
jgi:uncharacterized damage-inducible protein DinB